MVDTVFGVIQQDAGGLDGHVVEALGVGGKQVAHVAVADLGMVRQKCLEGCGRGECCMRHVLQS